MVTKWVASFKKGMLPKKGLPEDIIRFAAIHHPVTDFIAQYDQISYSDTKGCCVGSLYVSLFVVHCKKPRDSHC